ncbi:GNAT family N-acetyltransferase [Actinomadura hibisca]|uniref:GNAT family N-acetyltransferase n=1 Tax=Actinomadura hibisca TaxID=68565 RepID=UPI00082AD119|nr:GNAT family N-acetyltransferase [Actinomadura hibisca]
MTDRPELTFRRFDALAAREVRDVVQDIYVGSYTTAITSGDPFDSPERFMERFDAYTGAGRGFDMVIAYAQGEPVGQTWGWPLSPNASWWQGLEEIPEPGFTEETGTRTFALSEIMVRQTWQGRGVARALHDELLRGRHEARATLLVEPDNEVANRAYAAWGWKKAGRLRPSWPDAPRFDVLIRSLR